MRMLLGVALLVAGAITTLAFLTWAAFGLLLQRSASDAGGGDPPLIAGLWLPELVGAGVAAALFIASGLVVLRRAGARAPTAATARGSTRTVCGLVALAVTALFGPPAWHWYQYKVELAQSVLPPALLTTEQAGGQTPLFDGNSTNGWTIEGPVLAAAGTLEIGGEKATVARLERPIEPGETVRFHFKHVGPCHHPLDAKLYAEPILPDDADGALKYAWQQPPEHELRQSGLTPSGGLEVWHEAILQARLDQGRFDYTLELRQRIGQIGRAHV